MVILFQRTSLDNPNPNRVRQRKKYVKLRNELRAPGGAFPCKAVAEAVQVLNAFMRERDTLLPVSPVEYEALGFTEYEALGPAECEAPGPGASAEQIGNLDSLHAIANMSAPFRTQGRPLNIFYSTFQ